MRDSFYTNHWRDVRKTRVNERVAGIIRVTQVQSRIHVSAPFNEDFRKGALGLGARYRHKTVVWSFIGAQRQKVADLIGTVYGADAVPQWMKD